jgi:pyruvate dehydrogenase E2 component (dihydrolipoamide acetyltransferase)
MPTNILMPALSPTMEKGKLAKWLKKEGDKVSPGDIIAEIETDKATMEVESIDEGTLGRIVVPEGTDDVAVNSLIAVLLGEGENAAAIPATAGKPTPPAAAPPDKPPAAAPSPTATAAGAKAPATVVPARQGNGAAGGRLFASPLARRLAREKGVDLHGVKGSGPKGRIVARDIEAAKPGAAPPGAAAKPAAVLVAAMSDDAILKLFEPGSYELVPHDSMRKIVARRLTESKQTIPHFYLSLDCSLVELLGLRERLNLEAPRNKDGAPEWKISVNDFVIKALAMALMKVPEANVSWTEAAMVKHKHADVGVAVAIPGGLITPVVRQAEGKGLVRISTEMKDYAARARNRKLLPHEYQGGSTAVSNLGMYGITNFSAVINPPHGTILAVGAGERRPVARGDAIVIEQRMSVTLSTDHRAVDGALGAQLLGAFKSYIEDPGLMLV